MSHNGGDYVFDDLTTNDMFHLIYLSSIVQINFKFVPLEKKY